MHIPFDHIPIGRMADEPHQPVCLSDRELQGRTYILGDADSGADRILAAAAAYQASAGRPTVILDEPDHVRDHLNTFPYPGIQALTYHSFVYAPDRNPLSPEAPESDIDIHDAIRYHTTQWDDRLDQILPRTFRTMRQHNRLHPDARHLDLDDLSVIEYLTSVAITSDAVLHFRTASVAASDPHYWNAADVPGPCADAVRQIGKHIIDQKAQRRTFYHTVCGQLQNPQDPKKTLLVHPNNRYPWRHLVPPATKHAFTADAVNTLRTVSPKVQTPLLVMNQPQQDAQLDWGQITAPTDAGSMHTMLVTSQPLPELANADTVIICRASAENLSAVHNHCRCIADDLPQLIERLSPFNTGYLWSRSRKEGVFFVADNCCRTS